MQRPFMDGTRVNICKASLSNQRPQQQSMGSRSLDMCTAKLPGQVIKAAQRELHLRQATMAGKAQPACTRARC